MVEMARVCWGITGSGDHIEETLDAMITLQKETDARVDVIVSKAAEQVLRWYKIWDRLIEAFSKVKKETNANVPFVAGPLQLGRYDILIVAPLTANSTAKIAYGIADTLVTNAVAQTLKGNTPVLLFPVDQVPGEIDTVAHDGTSFSIKTRQIDLENAQRVREMLGVTIAASPQNLLELAMALL
ncbi:MAG: archaeoflavoprotein AfpA [Candidatus Thorarchaeota archaeon]|nr:MAG: archaeoflavoprotein AfpA [Candidatus Thorarchaeota archaeon]